MKHILDFIFYLLVVAFIIIVIFIFGLFDYLAFRFQNYILAVPLLLIIVTSILSLVYCLYSWIKEKE